MKKRIFSILCTCCMVIGLTAGCGASGSGNETNAQTSAKTESSSETKAADDTQAPAETVKDRKQLRQHQAARILLS